MAVNFRGDVYELKEIAEILVSAADVAPADARKVVVKGALNIKNDARRRASGLAHAPAYPAAITYDTRELPFGASAEIGPDKAKRQGSLGNVIEYGSVNNPPHPHMAPAGEAERPRFEKAMQDVAFGRLDRL